MTLRVAGLSSTGKPVMPEVLQSTWDDFVMSTRPNWVCPDRTYMTHCESPAYHASSIAVWLQPPVMRASVQIAPSAPR